MSCSPFDLRDFYLKELTDPQQRQVEAHVQDCHACQEELDRLRLTQAALFSLRDEEIPQRIAFVSDPVFEPSLARRWWAAFWGSSARLGFAGAAMLSVALLFSTLSRPAVSGGGLSAKDVEQRIQQAVAASEQRQTQQTTKLVHDLVQRVDNERDARLVAENDASYAKQQILQAQYQHRDYITLDGGEPR
jgi:anti-sigma factor RsiW